MCLSISWNSSLLLTLYGCRGGSVRSSVAFDSKTQKGWRRHSDPSRDKTASLRAPGRREFQFFTANGDDNPGQILFWLTHLASLFLVLQPRPRMTLDDKAAICPLALTSTDHSYGSSDVTAVSHESRQLTALNPCENLHPSESNFFHHANHAKNSGTLGNVPLFRLGH